MRLPHSQNDESENSEEVKCVTGDAIKGEECIEFADEDVGGCERGVEKHGVDGCEEKTRVIGDEFEDLAAPCSATGGIESDSRSTSDADFSE